jgi:hypothetical protein
MAEDLPIRRVEVSFAGAAPPAWQVARAPGVSDVEIDGSILRCLVCGSFQPFLEALRGHEVAGFDSTRSRPDKTEAGLTERTPPPTGRRQPSAVTAPGGATGDREAT